MAQAGSITKTKATLPVRLQALRAHVQSWSQEDPASLLLSGLVMMLAIAALVTMAIIDRRGYSVLPWGDMWDYWTWYLKPDGHLLTRLVAQHNEHRIAFPRLFFLADQMFFEGRSIFTFICIFLIQLCHAILLCTLAYLSRSDRKTTPMFLGSAAFLCLFSAEQYTNFTWAFQIQFVAVYFAITAALASLMMFAKASREAVPAGSGFRSRAWLAATIMMALIATYSMANGLLVWPLLLLAAFWFGVQRHSKVVILVAAIAMWFLYFWGYTTPPQHSSIREGLHNLPKSFAYAMCVLGSPLDAAVTSINKIFSIGGDNWRLLFTAAVGTLGLITGTFLWGYFLRHRREATQADVVILHVVLLIMVTVFLIGFGRVNFALNEALQSRYTTPALLFWFCILFLSSSFIERSSPANSSTLLLFQFASALILFLVIVLYQPTQLTYARGATFYLSDVESAISAPVYDKEIWSRIYYNPKAMIPTVRYLQNRQLSVFSWERNRWLGDPISAHFKSLDRSRCVGFVDAADALTESELPGFRVGGWAWDRSLRKIASSIVFTNKQGQIVGFGYTGFERPDVTATYPVVGVAGVGWKGYVAGLSHDSITAYMVTDSGHSSCLIGSRDLSTAAPPSAK